MDQRDTTDRDPPRTLRELVAQSTPLPTGRAQNQAHGAPALGRSVSDRLVIGLAGSRQVNTSLIAQQATDRTGHRRTNGTTEPPMGLALARQAGNANRNMYRPPSPGRLHRTAEAARAPVRLAGSRQAVAPSRDTRYLTNLSDFRRAVEDATPPIGPASSQHTDNPSGAVGSNARTRVFERNAPNPRRTIGVTSVNTSSADQLYADITANHVPFSRHRTGYATGLGVTPRNRRQALNHLQTAQGGLPAQEADSMRAPQQRQSDQTQVASNRASGRVGADLNGLPQPTMGGLDRLRAAGHGRVAERSVAIRLTFANENLSARANHLSPGQHAGYGRPNRTRAVRVAREQSARCAQTNTEKPFVPSTMVREGPGWQREKTPDEIRKAEESKMSGNYMGDPGNSRNYSDETLKNNQNCCFWLYNLPPTVTVNDVLSNIRNCCRIASFSISKGEAKDLGHAGAKLVFITEQGAARFWNQYGLNPGSLIVGGRSVRIRRNRIRVAQLNVPIDRTRCICVEGQPHVVNETNMDQFFRSKLVFQMDEVLNHTRNDRVACLEFRFSSFVGQAQMAMGALLAEPQFRGLPYFRVRYMPDPCA